MKRESESRRRPKRIYQTIHTDTHPPKVEEWKKREKIEEKWKTSQIVVFPCMQDQTEIPCDTLYISLLSDFDCDFEH